eukprot:SAG31_NODE_1688_length_7528_cov_14.515143_4_plen_286_part_00
MVSNNIRACHAPEFAARAACAPSPPPALRRRLVSLAAKGHGSHKGHVASALLSMSQIHQKSGAMRRSGTLSPLPPLPGAARSLHANGAAGSPKRPPTAIQNFAMGPVHAVLEPLLAQMFMDRPADPIRYIVQYFTGENRSGAAKMEQLMRDLAAAEERIRQLEAAANIQMPTTAAGTTPPPVSVAAGGTMSDANQKVICVLGGPASGKSTLCRMMAERGSHHVISVGQLLSEGIKDGTIVVGICSGEEVYGDMLITTDVVFLVHWCRAQRRHCLRQGNYCRQVLL